MDVDVEENRSCPHSNTKTVSSKGHMPGHPPKNSVIPVQNVPSSTLPVPQSRPALIQILKRPVSADGMVIVKEIHVHIG